VINGNFYLAIILLSVLSCDKKEEEAEITINDFTGSWSAISSVYTNDSNMDEVIDLISLGAELRFTMLERGKVRTWFTIDTISDEWDSQAVLTNQSLLTLTPVEEERGINTFEFELDNNTLRLTNNNSSFDFTLSGAPEVPASSVKTFERN